MRRALTIAFLSFGLAGTYAQSPNAQEVSNQKQTQISYLLQQIAALKVHLTHLKEGYDIVQKGLNRVSEIRDGKFSMDRGHLRSLQEVRPLVRNSPQVRSCLDLEQRMLAELGFLNVDCQQDESFSPAERHYISLVYEQVLLYCTHAMSELEIVLKSGNAKMKEQERLSRLDKVHERLIDAYAFTQEFVGGTRLLALQRSKEANEKIAIQKLYEQKLNTDL